MGGGWWRTHKIETQTQHGKPQTYQGRLLGTYIHHTIPGGKAGVYSHTTRVMKNREGGRREHMERGKACVTMLGRSPGTFPPPPPTHTHTQKKTFVKVRNSKHLLGVGGKGSRSTADKGRATAAPQANTYPAAAATPVPAALAPVPLALPWVPLFFFAFRVLPRFNLKSTTPLAPSDDGAGCTSKEGSSKPNRATTFLKFVRMNLSLRVRAAEPSRTPASALAMSVTFKLWARDRQGKRENEFGMRAPSNAHTHPWPRTAGPRRARTLHVGGEGQGARVMGIIATDAPLSPLQRVGSRCQGEMRSN